MSGFEGFAVVLPEKDAGFVELSATPKGTVFRKQILHYGDLLYPGAPNGGKVKVDEAFADSLVKNFKNHVISSVAVPKANEKNQHNEDPDRNIGEVINVLKGKDGIYVDMDIRVDADKIGKTLLGTSAMLHLNATDRRTGEKVGPTLIHNCVTNNAFVPDLGDFEELVAMTTGGVDITDENQIVVLTSAPEATKEKHMSTLDELFAELKSDHGIDVPELQKKAAASDAAVALSSKIQEELVTTGLLKLSNTDEEVTADVLVGAVAEAGTKIVELSSRVDGLVEDAAKKDAEVAVDKLVLSGHILPKDKEAMLELRLSNADLFDKLVPEKPVIKLSTEAGFEPTDEAHKKTVDDEITRLTAVASEKASAHVRA